MIERLGVFGGMFDPPHLGHIAAAQHAVQQLGLDNLKLIPCKIPNHRAHTQVSPEHRLNMLNLAIQAEPLLSIDALELERDGVSFMVDTLTILRERHPGAQIVLVLGRDSFNSLPSWHRYQDILSLSHLYVLNRRGELINDETNAALKSYGSEVGSKEEIFDRPYGCYFFDKSFAHDASSTLVRQERLLGKNLGGLLDPKVSHYIESHQLYQETSLIKERCTG